MRLCIVMREYHRNRTKWRWAWNALAKNSICKQSVGELFNYLRYCKMATRKIWCGSMKWRYKGMVSNERTTKGDSAHRHAQCEQVLIYAISEIQLRNFHGTVTVSLKKFNCVRCDRLNECNSFDGDWNEIGQRCNRTIVLSSFKLFKDCVVCSLESGE